MHGEKTRVSCGNLESRYVTPGLDENLSMTRGQDTYYYMADGLGSIRNLLDADETVLNTYDYYAFGDELSATEGVVSPYRFTAREREPGGLSHAHFYRNRYYMPVVGLFMSRDAFWADEHMGWGYVGNSVVGYVDPFGYAKCPSGKWNCRGTKSGWSLFVVGSYRTKIRCICTENINIGTIEYFSVPCCLTSQQQDIERQQHAVLPVYARAYVNLDCSAKQLGIKAGIGTGYTAFQASAADSEEFGGSDWSFGGSAGISLIVGVSAGASIGSDGFATNYDASVGLGLPIQAGFSFDNCNVTGSGYDYETLTPRLTPADGDCIRVKINVDLGLL